LVDAAFLLSVDGLNHQWFLLLAGMI